MIQNDVVDDSVAFYRASWHLLQSTLCDWCNYVQKKVNWNHIHNEPNFVSINSRTNVNFSWSKLDFCIRTCWPFFNIFIQDFFANLYHSFCTHSDGKTDSLCPWCKGKNCPLSGITIRKGIEVQHPDKKFVM